MASRFWVGGTGTWDNSDTTHWAATTGAAGGQSVPSSADTVTFDGASGGGTVTVAATINGSNTVQSITCGAFTGTLTFATNNPSIICSVGSSPAFSISGAGTRTINLGSGTFTLSGNNGSVWDAATTTGLTFNAGTSTILLNTPANGNNQTFAGGGLTYNILSIGARNSSGAQVSITGNNTFANILIATPAVLACANGSTQTISNAFAWNGDATNQLGISNQGSDSQVTIACQTGSVVSWAYIRGVAFTGTTVVATNSFNMGRNSGSTITAPSVGGGVVGVVGS